MCKEKLVALTIDDEPNPGTTKQILDVLKNTMPTQHSFA